jgi:hypothetical protein
MLMPQRHLYDAPGWNASLVVELELGVTHNQHQTLRIRL